MVEAAKTIENARCIVVANQPVVDGDKLLAKMRALKPNAAIVRESADSRADRIIVEMMISVAAASTLTTAGGSWLQTGIVAVGIVRIARVYGVSLTRQEAGKFAVEALTMYGFYGIVGVLGGKALATAIEVTGVGLVGGMALDAGLTAAVAFALGQVAKAYFGRQVSKGDFKRIMRSSLRQGKKLQHQVLREAGRRRGRAVPYASMATVLQTPLGREVIGHIVQTNPSLSKALVEFMSAQRLSDLDELSADRLQALDKESGLAQDLWAYVQDVVDVKTLTLMATSPEYDHDLVDTLRRLRAEGVNIEPITRDGAAQLLFPVGHPRPRIVYGTNPARTEQCFPLAQYHRFNFEHKFAEAVRLLRSLGVRELAVYHAQGRSQEWAQKIEVPLGLRQVGVEGQAGVEGRAKATSTSSQLFIASYQGDSAPRVPEDLVWYYHEPTWQEIAEARLEGRLSRFELHVRYTDDFGMNERLFAGLAEFGPSLELGGSLEEYEITEWRIQGSF
jgi:uncharacterized protein (DUF697 family)